jgi:hypothetical protein
MNMTAFLVFAAVAALSNAKCNPERYAAEIRANDEYSASFIGAAAPLTLLPQDKVIQLLTCCRGKQCNY